MVDRWFGTEFARFIRVADSFSLICHFFNSFFLLHDIEMHAVQADTAIVALNWRTSGARAATSCTDRIHRRTPLAWLDAITYMCGQRAMGLCNPVRITALLLLSLRRVSLLVGYAVGLSNRCTAPHLQLCGLPKCQSGKANRMCVALMQLI